MSTPSGSTPLLLKATAMSPPKMGPGTILPLPSLNSIAAAGSSNQGNTFSLKVTKAEFGMATLRRGEQERNHMFTPISHMYSQITEALANVTLTRAAIQRK